ncbi:glycosyltransferase [Tepidimonas taiwanensis]|uniref:glycosyltransferase n=1 Tax=Tepidimonas taiwanensis TaxID=307486 RepID=UPI00137ADC52|nr:glycosyltransferase [Tepidimonas taiwanensis]
MKNPLVSWLLCAHKLNDYLYQAIESCLCQTVQDFELLIVVNGDQRDVIEESIKERYAYDQRVKIYSTPIHHLTFSLNLGLHYAKADLIARMDADDISTPDRLEKQLEFMQKNPDTIVLGASANIIDESGRVVNTIVPPLDDKSIRIQLRYRNPIFHPSVMFRKSVIIQEGGYGGGIYAEDYDLWLRLSTRQDVKFANLSHACLNYRSFGVGEARRNVLAYASMAGSMMTLLVAKRRSSMLPGLVYTIAKSFVMTK